MEKTLWESLLEKQRDLKVAKLEWEEELLFSERVLNFDWIVKQDDDDKQWSAISLFVFVYPLGHSGGRTGDEDIEQFLFSPSVV